MFRVKTPVILMATLLILFFTLGVVQAVDFPQRNITLICPWAAGGGTDAVARILAMEAEKVLEEQGYNVSVLVENRTGAGGAIGHGAGARALSDGYTVTLTTVELIIQPHIEEVPFTYEDYRPIMQVNLDPAAITVPADAPWDTLEEFLVDAKKNPGRFRTSGTGAGGIWHMATLGLEAATGTSFTWVPSHGMGPAVTQLLGGHLEFVSGSPAEVAPQVETGEFRILAIFADERDPSFPDVPTMKELGFDLSIGTWRGLQVPKDTPDEVVNKLHDIFKQAYEAEGFRDTMKNLGLGMFYRSPEDYAQFLQESSEEFGELVEQFDL